MAERAWARRADLAHAPALTPQLALEHAASAPRGPILLLDVGDNVGAGSAGDSTFILQEAQRLGVRGGVTPGQKSFVASVALTLPGVRRTCRGRSVSEVGSMSRDA